MSQNKTQKKSWSAPAIQIIQLNVAEGAQAGPLCDKHGSLSSSNNGGNLGGGC